MRKDTLLLDGLPEESIKYFVEELGSGSPEDRLVEFLWERAREAEGILKEALTHIEGSKGSEKPVFRCGLYLHAIQAETDPEISDEILAVLE